MIKKDFNKLLEKALAEIETLNYAEQFLDLFPDFFLKYLEVSSLAVFVLNDDNTKFIPYVGEKQSRLILEPITWDSNLVTYLKNSRKTIVFRYESPVRIQFIKKTNPDFFEKLDTDIIIPLLSFKRLHFNLMYHICYLKKF